MVSAVERSSPASDDGVDEVISHCLDPSSPRSFFLYAGAGSGKTYSLVKGLNNFRSVHGNEFRQAGKKLAVITYTNAARQEIEDRVDEDPLFLIRTIHSFCWSQIASLNHDIGSWLLNKLPADIVELEEQEAKGRRGTKSSAARQKQIADKRNRIEWLMYPREFTYDPNGDNVGRASLSHSEVLKITGAFLSTKPSMQRMLVNRFPFILIDESQDTNGDLIDALFETESAQHQHFGLGLFGDVMQRIYGDGKLDLGANIPDRWARPAKLLNRRCPTRVIALANDIRATTDGQVQHALESAEDGFVRLFVGKTTAVDKRSLEANVRAEMATITGDAEWTGDNGVKTLTLEHRMSAIRMEFDGLFEPLYNDKRSSTGLLDGTLPALRFFSGGLQPILLLHKACNKYGLMMHLRKERSPLLDSTFLVGEADPTAPLKGVREGVAAVSACVEDETATFGEVLRCVAEHRLLRIPKSLSPFAADLGSNVEATDLGAGVDIPESDSESDSISAIGSFLDVQFCQLYPYMEYVSDLGDFNTHQGVKGREFPRVMVVMDDAEARGFLFSYEKLFEVKEPTPGDLKRKGAGKETGEDRTKRLFYVTATRAESSLALVAYTEDPARLSENVVNRGWFLEEEIIQL